MKKNKNRHVPKVAKQLLLLFLYISILCVSCKKDDNKKNKKPELSNCSLNSFSMELADRSLNYTLNYNNGQLTNIIVEGWQFRSGISDTIFVHKEISLSFAKGEIAKSRVFTSEQAIDNNFTSDLYYTHRYLSETGYVEKILLDSLSFDDGQLIRTFSATEFIQLEYDEDNRSIRYENQHESPDFADESFTLDYDQWDVIVANTTQFGVNNRPLLYEFEDFTTYINPFYEFFERFQLPFSYLINFELTSDIAFFSYYHALTEKQTFGSGINAIQDSISYTYDINAEQLPLQIKRTSNLYQTTEIFTFSYDCN